MEPCSNCKTMLPYEEQYSSQHPDYEGLTFCRFCSLATNKAWYKEMFIAASENRPGTLEELFGLVEDHG